MSDKRCLIIDSIHESIINLLEAQEVLVHYHPDTTREELLQMISDYHILIVRSKTPIDKQVFEKGSQLEIVARAGAGIENIDQQEAAQRNIQILNAPEANRGAVADHTVGMLLSLLNHLPSADAEVKSGNWEREKNRGVEMSSQTVGILGFGNMGSEFARRLSGFSCRVLAYDKYKSGFGTEQVEEVDLDVLRKESTILSVHLPLSAETNGLIDEAYIESFENPFFLVNTARGEIIPLSAIASGMRSGKILGAALDVLESEPPSSLTGVQREAFEELSSSDQVLMSPHIAGWSHESYQMISDVLGRKILNAIHKKS